MTNGAYKQTQGSNPEACSAVERRHRVGEVAETTGEGHRGQSKVCVQRLCGWEALAGCTSLPTALSTDISENQVCSRRGTRYCNDKTLFLCIGVRGQLSWVPSVPSDSWDSQ